MKNLQSYYLPSGRISTTDAAINLALGIVFLLGLGVGVAFAQLKSLSPDLIVDCSANPCTIKSASMIVKSADPSMSIDGTYIAKTLWRTSATAMKDTLVDASVIGDGNGFSVCTMAAQDTITAAAPIINGRNSLTVYANQCASFMSDGSQFLTVLSWQSSARQRCPSGQHYMVSGSPFLCSP